MDKKTPYYRNVNYPQVGLQIKNSLTRVLGEPNLGLLAFHSKTNLPTPGGGEGKGNVTQAQEGVWAANVQKT